MSETAGSGTGAICRISREVNRATLLVLIVARDILSLSHTDTEERKNAAAKRDPEKGNSIQIYELSLQDRKEELRNREGVVGEVELKIVVICCCFSWEGKSIVK